MFVRIKYNRTRLRDLQRFDSLRKAMVFSPLLVKTKPKGNQQ